MNEAQIVLTVTALVLSLLESAEAQTPHAQVTALEDLTKHWSTLPLADDVCQTGWLICDNGNVISLKLRDKNLTGSIPESVGNLTSLKELRLDNNKLTGSIPEFLGKLTSLEHLRLSTNELTDSIPKFLVNLKELEILYLDYNQLTGSIPKSLGNLTNLRLLSLENNLLDGSIPESLGNLKNLTDLYLNNNELTGSIPESLGNLKELARLYLNDNYLGGTIPGTLLRSPPAVVFDTTNNCLSANSTQRRDGCPPVPSPVSPPPPPTVPPWPTNSAPPLEPLRGSPSPGPNPFPPPPTSPAPRPTKEAPLESPTRAPLPGPSPVPSPSPPTVSHAPGPTPGVFLGSPPGTTLLGPGPVSPPPSEVTPAPGPTKGDPPDLGSRGNRSWVLAVAVAVPALVLVLGVCLCVAFWKKTTASGGDNARRAHELNHSAVLIEERAPGGDDAQLALELNHSAVPIEEFPEGRQQFPEPSGQYGELLVEGVWRLFEPKPPLSAEFDVVFFLGPRTVWQTRDGRVSCWPKEWLPEHLPQARLLMVEFPQDLLLWEGAINHAQALTIKKVKLGSRPYFLVGHSVGGVFLKEVLLKVDGNNKKMGNNCKGVVFYGVPQLDELPIKCALFGIPESQMGQLDRNESLKRYFNFQHIQKGLSTCCFIEKMETTIGDREMMVSAQSQLNNADPRWLLFIDANHFQVCMPKTKEDLIVMVLVDFIKSKFYPED